MVSPIRTLPVELLAKIFELFIDDNTHIRDVYLISRVCSHWRQIAHSTPQLWTRPLTVDLCKEKDIADGLKAWLARSTPLPLPISFMPVTQAGHVNPAILDEVLTVAPRSSSLLFPPMYDTSLPLVRRLAQRSLDSLEEMDLGIIDETDNLPLAFIVPRLRNSASSI
ncbi:hypothetical protein MSAN_01353000 [Mycena sanguinolenta]|uniref:F-box domain-containing protein n=1 Tax=Mycena sanguinolenta TaxID=230812 RepID=A0A8H7D3F4_9AGAR|nr:hypothetical protein MSAN_01353000 [Mycena sanguinolenta]